MHYTSRDVYESISKQTNDPIVEWKTCKVSGTQFPIYQSDLDFYDKISPIFNGVKYQIPTPTLCPEERQRRRLVRKNERKLYRRKCDATGESVISLYAPDPVAGKDYTIYTPKVWRSDAWNPIKYGKDFDFRLSFNQQFSDLLHEVPLVAIYIKNSENCEYNNIINDSKNCYLCVSTGYAENTFYTTISAWLNHCYDAYWLIRSENCYEAIDSDYCYECFYIQRCIQCKHCRYMINCTQCKNCWMCINITGAEYMILNTQYTKEEYLSIIDQLHNNKTVFQKYYIAYQKLQKTQPVDNANVSAENCVGGFITHSSNCKLCFDTVECVSCKYCSGIGLKASDCYDCGGGDVFENQWCYESCLIPLNHHTMFSYNCRNSHDLYYCFDCYDSANCFGCTGLRNKEYCILNTQYTKEEYESLLEEIIIFMTKNGERGEYFSPSISPFGYNETVAETMFPMERDRAIAAGYYRQDTNYDTVISNTNKLIQGNDVPDSISQVSDDILEKIIICETSARPFRITKTELEFYRKYNLPLPHKHPDVRHQERIAKRPPRDLYVRNCDKCQIEMLSVYAGDFMGKVYCEKCYNKAIYG